jgi:hypothetical protein
MEVLFVLVSVAGGEKFRRNFLCECGECSIVTADLPAVLVKRSYVSFVTKLLTAASDHVIFPRLDLPTSPS